MLRRIIHHRMALWLLISLLLLLPVALIAPHQLGVSVYKLSLITSAAWLGYWIDRSLFPYARPDRYLETPFSPGAPFVPGGHVKTGHHTVFAAAMLRRAGIIAAAMIGVALGA